MDRQAFGSPAIPTRRVLPALQQPLHHHSRILPRLFRARTTRTQRCPAEVLQLLETSQRMGRQADGAFPGKRVRPTFPTRYPRQGFDSQMSQHIRLDVRRKRILLIPEGLYYRIPESRRPPRNYCENRSPPREHPTDSSTSGRYPICSLARCFRQLVSGTESWAL